MSDFRTTNFGAMLWSVKWCFHHIFCTCSKAHFFLFLPVHFYSDLLTFIVVFGLELKCTRTLKFVSNCFVDLNSIGREWFGHAILPTYAGGNAQRSGSPVLVQVV